MGTLKTIGKWALGLALAGIALVALVLVGTTVVSMGATAYNAAFVASPVRQGSTQLSKAPTVKEGNEVSASEISEIIQNMEQIRENLTATTLITDTAAVTSTGVYTYTPGGESYGQVAQDVTLPDGEEEGDCYRVWQATNLVDIPWTFLMCNIKATENMKQQWPHPTEFVVSNGTVEFDLYRDLGAVAQLKSLGIFTEDPYNQALQNGKIGLGWFFSGFNGEVCVNGVCESVDGGGTLQISFPQNFDGHYHIELKADEGQIRMWQGARVTTTDNWPLP